MNNQGLIIKATGGFYYVKCGDAVYECRARGIFRKEGISPLVGDFVGFTLEGETGTVAEILPRRNELARPPVSNLDRLVIVSATVTPSPDCFTIDRLAVIAEHKGIEPVIVFTKIDLADAGGLPELYKKAGFETFAVSSRTGEGIDTLRTLLQTGVSAFSGNSGVGKSSLINRLVPRLDLEVGAVSEKLGRGRQTTRTVGLYEIGSGYVADTPGFSSIDIESSQPVLKDELMYQFRDFAPYIGQCRFHDCQHVGVSGCAVTEAVEAGAIAGSRYESYCALYNAAGSIIRLQISAP